METLRRTKAGSAPPFDRKALVEFRHTFDKENSRDSGECLNQQASTAGVHADAKGKLRAVAACEISALQQRWR